MEHPTETSDGLQATTISVSDTLMLSGLSIPHYQRPYKWQQRHVAQLLEDIQRFQNKSAYRLGSLVLHQENGRLDIVDGQQRIVTLTLILRAYMRHNPEPQNLKLRQMQFSLKERLFNPELTHPISRQNAIQNLRFIEQYLNNLSEDTILFLLEKCEFVKFTLQDLNSAFQFFDSQNARGKDLDPHDLLKAFHLRAFAAQDEGVKELVIEKWENTETRKLTGLFQYFLYRIKAWSDNQSARFFTKADVDIFKGVDLKQTHGWPYTRIIRMADVYTRMYNKSFDREIDDQTMTFPFQLEMPVVNGRMFFEMVTHYLVMSEAVELERIEEKVGVNSQAKKIIDCLKSYDGRHRDGDRYIHQLFKATLLQYIDKFGYDEFESAIVHLFVWAYRLRLEMLRVQLATMDNHAFGPGSYIHIIRKALKPKEVLVTPFPLAIDLKYKKTEELQKVFRSILGDKIFSNA